MMKKQVGGSTGIKEVCKGLSSVVADFIDALADRSIDEKDLVRDVPIVVSLSLDLKRTQLTVYCYINNES